MFAKYLSTTSASQASTSLAIFDAIAAAYGVSSGGEVFDAFQGQFSGASLVAQSAGDVPEAYLNYIFYDENYENPQVGFAQVTSSSENAYAALNLSLTAPTDGYLFTYLSNESSLDVDVYFDNYTVTHTSSATVMQADDYYPFGLPIASNNYEEPGNKNNRFLYQGKEWQTALALNLYDFHARQYDPVTGRFLSNDPKNQFASGYVGMGNMPTLAVDPDGELAWFVPIIIGAAVGGTVGGIRDGWEGAITGAFLGAAAGTLTSAAIGAKGIMSATGGVTKAWGTTTSIIQSANINMAISAASGGEAWKAGLAGAATGAFSVTGGFGLAKKGLAGKLAYQSIGTSSSSILNNWAAGEDPFSKITLGVGPVNFTLGEGQNLIQPGNNIGNILANGFGLTNDLLFGGNTKWDWKNLTPVYRGGLIDKFAGSWGPFAPMLMGDQELEFDGNGVKNPWFDPDLFAHESHHLWQSRALGDSYALHYLSSGLPAGLMKTHPDFGKIIWETHTLLDRFVIASQNAFYKYNYYETLAFNLHWWK